MATAITKGDVSKTKERKRKAPMVVFRDSDGVLVDEAMMPTAPFDSETEAGMALARTGGTADAASVRCLFKDEATGLSLVHVWFKGGFVLPRHSHNADCVYYIIAGEIHMGNAVLHQGDGFFVPADQGYTYTAGPEGVELLEFRNATHFNIDLKGNDPGIWQRMVDAAIANKDSWRKQTKPPLRR